MLEKLLIGDYESLISIVVTAPIIYVSENIPVVKIFLLVLNTSHSRRIHTPASTSSLGQFSAQKISSIKTL